MLITFFFLLLNAPIHVFSESKATIKQQHPYIEERNTKFEEDKPYDVGDVKGPPPMASLYDEGFWLISPEDRMRIWAWAQEDYRAFGSNYPIPSTFLNRRVRFGVLGTLEYHFNYQLLAGFERSTNPVLFSWVEYAQFESVKARIGAFKEPFSLEELTFDLWLDTLDRSMIVLNLSPSFDIGAMLRGFLFDSTIEYAVGAFNGKGIATNDNRNDKNVASRVSYQPFRHTDLEKLKVLYLSVNGTWGFDEENLANTSYRTMGGTPFWNYPPGAVYQGERWRLGTDILWVYGPYSFKAEWNKSFFENIHIVNTNTSADGIFNGYYLTATWLVTGDKKTRGTQPIKPNKNFDPLKNQWGAIELVCRWEQFFANDNPLNLFLATGTDQVNAVTLGINWYFNHQIRGGFNYVQSDFQTPIGVNNRLVNQENLFLFRGQFEI